MIFQTSMIMFHVNLQGCTFFLGVADNLKPARSFWNKWKPKTQGAIAVPVACRLPWCPGSFFPTGANKPPRSCEYIPPLGTYISHPWEKENHLQSDFWWGCVSITFLVQKKNNQTRLSLDPFQRKSTRRNRLLFPRPISNSNLQYKSPLIYKFHIQVLTRISQDNPNRPRAKTQAAVEVADFSKPKTS